MTSAETDKKMLIARLVREYGRLRASMMECSAFDWFDLETVLEIDRHLLPTLADAVSGAARHREACHDD